MNNKFAYQSKSYRGTLVIILSELFRDVGTDMARGDYRELLAETTRKRLKVSNLLSTQYMDFPLSGC